LGETPLAASSYIQFPDAAFIPSEVDLRRPLAYCDARCYLDFPADYDEAFARGLDVGDAVLKFRRRLFLFLCFFVSSLV
jgi:hypothetical protein